MTEKEARGKVCHMALNHPETHGVKCIASECIAWEWTSTTKPKDYHQGETSVEPFFIRCDRLGPMPSVELVDLPKDEWQGRCKAIGR